MWRVIVRKANYSAFNGYRRTPSAYSDIQCGECGGRWRTNAAYVDSLPDGEMVIPRYQRGTAG